MNVILNPTSIEPNIALFNQWVMLIAFLTFIVLAFREAFTPLIQFDRKTTRDSIATNSAAFIFNLGLQIETNLLSLLPSFKEEIFENISFTS